MPPAVGIAIAGIASGIAAIHGSNVQSNSANSAAALQAKANADALAESRRQNDLEQASKDAALAESKRQWDVGENFKSQVYNTQQARLAPYRAASTQALGRLGDLLGMHFDTSAPPPATYQMQPFDPNGTATPTPPPATATPAASPPALAPAMNAGPAASTPATSPSYTPVIPFSQLYQTQRNLAARPQ